MWIPFLIIRSVDTWKVGAITDMSNLFDNKATCNPAIGGWDTSAVTTFVSTDITFKRCAFQSQTRNRKQDDRKVLYSLSDSNSCISFLTHHLFLLSLWFPLIIGAMFYEAAAFNQPLSDWDTSSATNFVSNQNKRFCMTNTKYHTRWPQGFVFSFRQQQLYLILDSPPFSTFALIPIDNRMACFMKRLRLTNHFLIGTHQVQLAL